MRALRRPLYFDINMDKEGLIILSFKAVFYFKCIVEQSIASYFMTICLNNGIQCISSFILKDALHILHLINLSIIQSIHET